MKTKIALITTTINVPEVLRLHATRVPDDCELDVVVAGDVQTPQAARDLVYELGGTYLGVDDDAVTRWESNDHIGFRSIQRRNLALLHALTLGPDIVVTIDDDNRPIDANYLHDFVRGFTDPVTTLTHTDTGWWNPGSLLEPTVTHRGFPIAQRHRVHTETLDSVSGYARVGVVAGLCLGDPDVDAIERIVNRPHVRDVRLPNTDNGVVLGATTWAPFNTQNTAYAWEVAPLMQCLLGVGRYDDIWMSYVARCVMHSRGWNVRYGLPLVTQVRNEHDLVRDLKDEYHGYLNTSRLIERLHTVVDDVVACGSVIDQLEDTYVELRPFFAHFTDAGNRAWINDVRVAVAEGTHARERRSAELLDGVVW